MAVLPTNPPAFDERDIPGTVEAMAQWAAALQEALDWKLAALEKMLRAGKEK